MKKLAAIIPDNQYYRFVIAKKHHYFTKCTGISKEMVG
jgi:hypothetical protein